ncbi:MAG: histone deacetylase [Chloroflexi bacterium]|nr:histone deacetylase [Chloroflexota bacterium]
MNSCGFVYDPIFLEHDTGSHPENASRMTATMALLEECGLLAELERIQVRAASPEELALVHDPRYVAGVRRLADEGGGWVDPDTLITPQSYEVAAHVVGGTLNALDAVMRGEVRSAYCLVRPPGHHATPVQAMGFCLFNHVAIAAAYALERHGLERVAIVDYDVHHGNGTQDAFYAQPRVLYASTHEYPFYPGTGAAEEIGSGEGRGFNINIPMPHGSGDAEHRRAFEEMVAPALRRFQPQLIIVSAGYDAHFADEIAMQKLSVDGYGALTSIVKAAADELCDGRLLVAQEGGYHLTALPWCVRRTIELLRGDEPTPDPLGTVATRQPAGFDEMLARVKQLHAL